jgi:hypothetical protein
MKFVTPTLQEVTAELRWVSELPRLDDLVSLTELR